MKCFWFRTEAGPRCKKGSCCGWAACWPESLSVSLGWRWRSSEGSWSCPEATKCELRLSSYCRALGRCFSPPTYFPTLSKLASNRCSTLSCFWGSLAGSGSWSCCWEGLRATEKAMERMNIFSAGKIVPESSGVSPGSGLPSCISS